MLNTIVNDQKLRGSLDIKLWGPNGELKDSRFIPNLVVQNGKNYIANRMVGATGTTITSVTSSPTSCMTHMALGTSTLAASTTDTQLGSTGVGEVVNTGDITNYARILMSSITISTGVVTYVTTFGVNNPQRTITSNTTAITEAGIFNSSAQTSGTMLCRTTFNPVNKGNDDTLQITWTVTVS